MALLAMPASASNASLPRPREDAVTDVERIFRAHYAFVRRVLSYWGVPTEASDDAIQDVFVVVTRRLTDLTPGTDERSWLLGIGRRVARNYRRSADRLRKRRARLRALTPSEAPRSLSQTHQDADLARRLLLTLPERLRVVFVLADLEGWTAPEISEALDLNLNTAYTRLRAARRRLEEAHAALLSDGGTA